MAWAASFAAMYIQSQHNYHALYSKSGVPYQPLRFLLVIIAT